MPRPNRYTRTVPPAPLYIRDDTTGEIKAADPATVFANARVLSDKALIGRKALTDPSAAKALLSMRMLGLDHEQFIALWLDTKHRVLAVDVLSVGTLNAASVYPREVVKAALAHNAAAVIFAHNHPSGIAEPSDADRVLTRRLKDALLLLDIRTLDHFSSAAAPMSCRSQRGVGFNTDTGPAEPGIERSRLMSTKITVVEQDSVTRAYGFAGTVAIIEHPRYGRILLQDGFGGLDSPDGGCVRWRHGSALRLLAGDTLDSLGEPYNDWLTVMMAAAEGRDPQRQPLNWSGHNVDRVATAAGLI